MSELLEDIGHNVRRLREAKGWNQVELSFHADTSPSIVSLIENGKRNPSTATLAKIAGALGVEVVDLFPKARPPLLEPDEAHRLVSKWWVDALEKYVEGRIDKYDAEVQDPQSPHFRTATAATLWVAQVEEEAAMWSKLVHEQVAPILPEARGEGWWKLLDAEVLDMALSLAFPLLGFDHVADHGKVRIEDMSDKPDELVARRLAKASAEAREAQEDRKRLEERLDEWRRAADG